MASRASSGEEKTEPEQEIFSTPKGEKKERGARGKYRKTVEKDRLRAKSVGSIETFVKRKRGERGSSEDKEEIGVCLKNPKMFRSPPEKRSSGEKDEKSREAVEIREKDKDQMEEERLKEMRAMMMEVMGIYEEKNTKRVEEIKKEIIQEMAELRNEMRKWEEVREKMEKRMKSLEQKLEKQDENNKKIAQLENRIVQIEKAKPEPGIGKSGNNERERLRQMERRLERKEREERKRNVVIKGLRLEGKELKEEVENVFKRIDAKVEIEEVRSVGKETRREKIVLVKLKKWEHKRDVMTKKRKLYGSSERIEDDLTWMERSMQYKLRKIAEQERSKGKRTWVKYGRIQIEEVWWVWDEEREEIVRNEVTGN